MSERGPSEERRPGASARIALRVLLLSLLTWSLEGVVLGHWNPYLILIHLEVHLIVLQVERWLLPPPVGGALEIYGGGWESALPLPPMPPVVL